MYPYPNTRIDTQIIRRYARDHGVSYTRAMSDLIDLSRKPIGHFVVVDEPNPWGITSDDVRSAYAVAYEPETNTVRVMHSRAEDVTLTPSITPSESAEIAAFMASGNTYAAMYRDVIVYIYPSGEMSVRPVNDRHLDEDLVWDPNTCGDDAHVLIETNPVRARRLTYRISQECSAGVQFVILDALLKSTYSHAVETARALIDEVRADPQRRLLVIVPNAEAAEGELLALLAEAVRTGRSDGVHVVATMARRGMENAGDDVISTLSMMRHIVA